MCGEVERERIGLADAAALPAAALQLTTLYRTSLSSAKRSYASGYAQSLHDILDVVLLRLQQSPTSAPGYRSQMQQQHRYQPTTMDSSDREELKWLVRYLRARIEAIKAESEDEEEKDSEEDEEETTTHMQGGGQASDVGRSENQDVIAGSPSTVPAKLVDAEKQAEDDGSGDKAVESVALPSSTMFHFSPPSSSTPAFPARSVPLGGARRKLKGGLPTPHGATSVLVQPPPPTRSSPSSEEETAGNVASQQTPSKRTSTRLGKRTSGRDKTMGSLDLFGRSINAKRRRGLGDRKDDDRRDGGLQ